MQQVHQSALRVLPHISAAGDSAETSSSKKPRRPDGWKDRLPRNQSRHGVALKQTDPDKFERMRLILGYYDLPENRDKPGAAIARQKLKEVTVSHLQTLCHLDFDPEFTSRLLSYRLKTVNEQVAEGLQQTNAFLQEITSQQHADFVPSIPGVTTSEAPGNAT